MFWIALSLLIMSLTGEGDDTFAFRKIIERARDGVEENVHDPTRKQAAIATLDRASADFRKHRVRVGKISACVEKADRNYTATEADYERCLTDIGPAWDAAADDLIELERVFRSSLTPSEHIAVRHAAEW